MSMIARFVAVLTVTCIFLSAANGETLSNEAMFARLSALASSANADINYNLGMFLNNGIGTPRDNQAAFKYFSEAAETGHELASYKVGCYLAGQFPGVVPVNLIQALNYKLRAAEAGYDLAQFDVGMYYFKQQNSEKSSEKNSEKSIEKALLWWERSSRQGNLQASIYLANYLYDKSLTDKTKAYALMLILKERMPSATKQLLDHIASLETQLTSAETSEAMSIRASWLVGKTPLTIKAQAGIASVPALLAALEH